MSATGRGDRGGQSEPDPRGTDIQPTRSPDLEPDVERIHRPIFREPHDPVEGRERVPAWLWVAAAALLFWGGWYLGRYGGDFGTATHVARTHIAPGHAEPTAEQPRGDDATLGKRVYERTCQACHQADGRGLPGTFPPVVGSEWVVGDASSLLRIVLNGVQGPIEVAGQSFDGLMPPWKDQLSDQEIAAVVSYIRQWGPNDAGPVDAAAVADIREVASTRTAPWTVAELQQKR